MIANLDAIRRPSSAASMPEPQWVTMRQHKQVRLELDNERHRVMQLRKELRAANARIGRLMDHREIAWTVAIGLMVVIVMLVARRWL